MMMKSPFIELFVAFLVTVIAFGSLAYGDNESWLFWLLCSFTSFLLFSIPTLVALYSHVKHAKHLRIRSFSDYEIVIVNADNSVDTIDMNNVREITTIGSPGCIKEDPLSLFSWDSFFFIIISTKHGQNYIISSFYDQDLPKLGTLQQRIIPIVLERDVHQDPLEDLN